MGVVSDFGCIRFCFSFALAACVGGVLVSEFCFERWRTQGRTVKVETTSLLKAAGARYPGTMLSFFFSGYDSCSWSLGEPCCFSAISFLQLVTLNFSRKSKGQDRTTFGHFHSRHSSNFQVHLSVAFLCIILYRNMKYNKTMLTYGIELALTTFFCKNKNKHKSNHWNAYPELWLTIALNRFPNIFSGIYFGYRVNSF